ncbi:MAG TPA: hypothetical protein VGI98_06340 [Candidatus Limnocylindrales bacterium]
MNDTAPFDGHADEDLEHALAAYASARLSPDRWATNRMRVAVIEHARSGAPAPAVGGGLERWWGRFQRLGFVALVAALAITGGSAAGVAASPGGPLYGVRVQIETALLPSGTDRTNAQIALLTERSDELTEAIKDGDQNGAGAAGDAYGKQLQQLVDDSVSNPSGGPTAAEVAKQRADLMTLRAALERQLAHLLTIAKPNDTAAANLENNIAKTQAALDTVDAKLAALPTP